MEQESWIYRTEVQERDLGWRYQLGFISIHIQETEQDHQSVNKTNIWAQGHSNVKRLKRIWWRLRRSEKWYRRKQRMRYTESQWREVIKDPLTNFQPHQLLLSTIPNYCLITVYDLLSVRCYYTLYLLFFLFSYSAAFLPVVPCPYFKTTVIRHETHKKQRLHVNLSKYLHPFLIHTK